ILLEQNVLTDEQLQQAIGEQRRTGELLGAALVRMGFVSEDILVGCLHRQLGLPVVDLNECVPEPEALALIKEELAKKHIALPIVAEKRTLQVAMADPLNVAALEDLRFHSNRYIQPLLARPSTIAEAIERYYNMDQSVSAVIDEILGDEDDLEVATVDDGKQGERVEDLIRESEGRP